MLTSGKEHIWDSSNMIAVSSPGHDVGLLIGSNDDNLCGILQAVNLKKITESIQL